MGETIAERMLKIKLVKPDIDDYIERHVKNDPSYTEAEKEVIAKNLIKNQYILDELAKNIVAELELDWEEEEFPREVEEFAEEGWELAEDDTEDDDYEYDEKDLVHLIGNIEEDIGLLVDQAIWGEEITFVGIDEDDEDLWYNVIGEMNTYVYIVAIDTMEAKGATFYAAGAPIWLNGDPIPEIHKESDAFVYTVKMRRKKGEKKG
ncbi:hypothetical protein AN618_24360 [Fervidicola ferrireducens]|uniref:Uncharacterized protein n=1 Tax=Fervidicola ferrireducens TaxID=520764 RepID=A0A140L0B7_9FIRM|nr:hypothetical protein [Fervidicola ferrireducens]KXG73992.1 hypothetical protein AN618_24360 [Fervidicola ferrireducens]